MSGTDVTNDEIKPLLALQALEYLDLGSTNVRNVEAIFNSQGHESATSEFANNILRPSSHPNLSINLQYTIRVPLAAEGINGNSLSDLSEEELEALIFINQLKVNTPEELYEQLNNSEKRLWRDLTFSYTPSLKQLQHIVLIQPYLEILRLSGTAVSDISPLAGLTDLRHLDLSDTSIADGSALGALTKLEELLLDRTTITGLLPFVSLTNLRALTLRGTVIVDITPLAGRQGLDFHTNVGILRKGARPTEIERYYYNEMLKKAPPTARPLTKNTDTSLRMIATQAADYLRSTRIGRRSFLRFYGQKTREYCLQRARYEMGRISKIQQLIKDSEEFMNLSDQEKHYATWIKAEMLASIEGRLLPNHLSSDDLFARAQKELADAEKELLSETSSQLRCSYLHKGYSEETFRLYQLLCQRYMCKYGTEPKKHISEALSTISCEIMNRDSYAFHTPQKRTYSFLGMADSLFRDFSFEFFGEEWRVDRTYNRTEETSCMLQTYQRNQRLFPSLFERLWLQLSSGL